MTSVAAPARSAAGTPPPATAASLSWLDVLLVLVLSLSAVSLGQLVGKNPVLVTTVGPAARYEARAGVYSAQEEVLTLQARQSAVRERLSKAFLTLATPESTPAEQALGRRVIERLGLEATSLTRLTEQAQEELARARAASVKERAADVSSRRWIGRGEAAVVAVVILLLAWVGVAWSRHRLQVPVSVSVGVAVSVVITVAALAVPVLGWAILAPFALLLLIFIVKRETHVD